MTTRHLLVSALAAIVLSACGGNDDDQQSERATAVAPLTAEAGGNPLFARIDADTVMVGANLAPAPDEVIDHLWESMSTMGDLNEASYDELAESVEGESPVLSALLEELSTIEDRESLEALGVHSNGFWAAHMLSVYPMLHVELTDPAAFQAMLDRVASNSETPLPRRQVAGEEIVWIENDGLGLALHHDERFATLALVPDDEAMLRRVVNLDAPSRAFDPAELARFNDAQGFVPHGSGFLDIAGLLGRLMDPENDRAAPARAQMDLEALAADPACQQEMAALAAVFPRISAGLSALDRSAFDMKMVIEAESGMASRMSAIADTPVGLTQGQTRTLSGGIAFD
ncbi:MAG: hypothetical protein V2J10_04460, partial [Wenzhouxiangella sp.]|nr:hypothetical protein [Wenzhouxiangella sp.]